MAISPEKRIADLEMIDEAERQQVLLEWNNTWRAHAPEQCIHQWIELQAEKTPEAIAVVFESQAISYQELNRRANKVAHRLLAMDIGPEDHVGICMQRSLEMVVAALAVLKAGAAYVPLDPDYPTGRLAFMVDDSQIAALITHEAAKSKLPACGMPALILEPGWTGGPEEPAENPDRWVSEQNPAYMLYTSGSTGRPKGVVVTHLGLCNHMAWIQETYPLTAADSVLHKTAFSFDVSMFELFWPLMTGARLVIALPGGHRDAKYLSQLIQRESITVIYFVASMLQVFLDHFDPASCASLRHVFCGGEPLPAALQGKFFDLCAGELHNIYGPTETTIDSTYWNCTPGDPHQKVPIGRHVSNTRIYVLDQELRPVPPGISGEIYIAGDGLARGYLRDPQGTAARFIPDPFAQGAGQRLYRTGDIGRWRYDGVLEYQGRVDEQVKVHGNRVELGDIEESLRKHESIADAAVTVREDQGGQKQLVAYIVSNERGPVSPEKLRSHLQQYFPGYMVPGIYVPLKSFPLTPNGKLDRRALSAPSAQQSSPERRFVAPRYNIEAELAGIWERLLGVHPVGVLDNFFELGGSSLTALKCIHTANEQLKMQLPVAALFQHPTIEALAEVAVQGLRHEAFSGARVVSFQPRGPLTTGAPIVYVHPLGGNAYGYSELARSLGNKFPF